MLWDYFLYAVEGLRHRKMRSWLTMIGIFIGIAAVVSLISLGEGLKEAITGQFAGIGTDRIVIQNANAGFGPPGSTAIKPLTEHDKKLVEKTKGIEIVVARLLRATQIRFKDETKVQFVVSWPEKKEEGEFILDSFSFSVAEGKMLQPGDNFKAVVGNDYNSKKIFAKPIGVGDKIKVNGFDFQVIGIMDKTGNPQLDSVAILMQNGMKDILGIGDEIDIMAAKIRKGEDAAKVSEGIAKNLRKDRDLKRGEEDFQIETPQQVVATFNTIFFIVQAVVVGIAFVSLVVGGIGITNTMYTAVLERTKEIGIMKAIGAKNDHIFMIFFIESGMLGSVGGIIGILLGYGFGKLAEGIGRTVLGTELLAPIFSPALIMGALLFAFLVGSISGVMPAVQASRLKPVEALRYAK